MNYKYVEDNSIPLLRKIGRLDPLKFAWNSSIGYAAHAFTNQYLVRFQPSIYQSLILSISLDINNTLLQHEKYTTTENLILFIFKNLQKVID